MALQQNPQADTFKLPEGYKDLGWQLHSGNSVEVKTCREAKHKTKEFDNSTHLNRCTNVIII